MATHTLLTHQGREEIPRAEAESESESPLPHSEKGAESGKIEPSAVEVPKNDCAPASDVSVEDKLEVEKDSLRDAVKSTPEEEPTAKVEEQPKMVDIPGPSKEVEKKDSVVSEVEGKLEGQSEVTEKIETISTEVEKPDSVVPEVKAKIEGQLEQVTEKVEILFKELEKPDSIVAEGKSEVIQKVETISTELEKSGSEKPEIEVKPEAPSQEAEDSTSLKEEKTCKEDEVQSSLHDVTGEEKEAKTTKTEGGIEEKSAKTEESTQPIKEVPKSELEVKDRESSDKLELSKKDGDGRKTSEDLPEEVPAKPTQKQSNKIISKVKQSLVKAKKAIIGKSSSSKALSSQTKGDIKVK